MTERRWHQVAGIAGERSHGAELPHSVGVFSAAPAVSTHPKLGPPKLETSTTLPQVPSMRQQPGEACRPTFGHDGPGLGFHPTSAQRWDS